MNDFDTALSAFIAALDAAGAKQNATMPNLPNYYKPFTVEAGSKYLRVVANSGGSRSVHCFVEKATGSIYKAAGWKQKAAGVRGNIYDPASYTKADVYGSYLYR